jgi:hypothetical protein
MTKRPAPRLTPADRTKYRDNVRAMFAKWSTFDIDADAESRVVTMRRNGETVATFNMDQAPGLLEHLSALVVDFHFALNIAKVETETDDKRKRGGKIRARPDTSKRDDAIRAAYAAEVAKATEPRDIIGKLGRRFPLTTRRIRDIVKEKRK